MSPLSPSYDNKIERKYSMKTLDQKSKNKTALQKELGWPAEPKMPVACVIHPLDKKSAGLLKDLLPGIGCLGVQLIVVHDKKEAVPAELAEAAKEFPHRIALLPHDDEHVRKALAAADVSLFLADAAKHDELLEGALNYGSVPVCGPAERVSNYNPVQESGNAFVYDEHTVWHCYAGMVRALETFKFPYDWRTIQRHCMEKNKDEAE